MDNSNNVAGILLGMVLIFIGISILLAENPTVGRYGFSFPTFYWVGWLSLCFGIYTTIVCCCSFRTSRKKRLAALARCKARRAQEAEAAKAEDNQHP